MGLRYITTDISRLEEMTLREFLLQREAYFLRKLDIYENNAQMALMNRKALETYQKNGKEYYKNNSVKDLIDIEDIENTRLGKKNVKNSRLVKIAKRVKEINNKKGGANIV